MIKFFLQAHDRKATFIKKSSVGVLVRALDHKKIHSQHAHTHTKERTPSVARVVCDKAGAFSGVCARIQVCFFEL